MAAADPPLAETLARLIALLRSDHPGDAEWLESVAEEDDPARLHESLAGERFWGGEGSVVSRETPGHETPFAEAIVLVGAALEDFGWDTPRSRQVSLLMEDWLHRPPSR